MDYVDFTSSEAWKGGLPALCLQMREQIERAPYVRYSGKRKELIIQFCGFSVTLKEDMTYRLDDTSGG